MGPALLASRRRQAVQRSLLGANTRRFLSRRLAFDAGSAEQLQRSNRSYFAARRIPRRYKCCESMVNLLVCQYTRSPLPACTATETPNKGCVYSCWYRHSQNCASLQAHPRRCGPPPPTYQHHACERGERPPCETDAQLQSDRPEAPSPQVHDGTSNDRSSITVRDLTSVVGGVFVTPGVHMRGVGVAGGPFYFPSTAHMVGYPRVPRDPNLAEAIASAVPRSGP